MPPPSVAQNNHTAKMTLAPPFDLAVLVLLFGFAVMYVPTYYTLSQSAWGTDSNGHGPMILGLCFWLLWRERVEILEDAPSAPLAGSILLLCALLFYIVGRSQAMDTLEVGSQIPCLMGVLLLLRGWHGLKKAWFPVFFLIFMVPLPGVFTQMLTLPLKTAVSWCAEYIMHAAGFPIGRSGVTLAIGPYQLLVADACSGLNSIFTLESLGLFYMKLMNYRSRARNILLATMIIPISFASNVTRVLALILITYYFGDEVGQGFMHNFAGMVLFTVAMLLTYGFDRILALKFDAQEAMPAKGVQA